MKIQKYITCLVSTLFLFVFSVVIKDKCQECKRTLENHSYTLIQSISVAKSKSIQELLYENSVPYIMDGYLCKKCKNCQKQKKCELTLKFNNCPQLFVLHLMLHESNIFNDEVITLDSKIVAGFTTETVKYKLKSIIRHHGTRRAGHYVAIADYDEKWYLIDDASINNNITAEDVKCKVPAFLLLYEKI